MSIAKIIEVISESGKSWEDAAEKAIEEASETVHGIKHLYVENMTAEVKDGKITRYRLNAKLTFIVNR